MYSTEAIGKRTKESGYEKITIQRGWTSEDDLDIDVKFCGFCHTDVHLANNDWGFTQYPMVPGHELAGVVTKVGANVKDIKVGDHVGIGYYMDSCLECEYCTADDEVNCAQGMTGTAAGLIKFGRVKTDNGKYPYGGWSKRMTANRRFVSKIPEGYPLDKAGPIFCAGITMYTPLVNHGASQGGLNVGIAGFGGLGQMGVMMAKAMGNNVTVISTSAKKEAAARAMGATNFVVSKDAESLKANAATLHLLLDTISAPHDVETYLGLLKKKATFVMLGAASEPFKLHGTNLLMNQYRVTGSATGGMKITQECVDFMAKHNLAVTTKMITSLAEVQEAEDALDKGNDGGVRYVIDIDKTLA